MQFTGRKLELVKLGLELALAEIHNQIATCPDVYAFEEDLALLDVQHAEISKLLDRVNRAVEAEQTGAPL